MSNFNCAQMTAEVLVFGLPLEVTSSSGTGPHKTMFKLAWFVSYPKKILYYSQFHILAKTYVTTYLHSILFKLVNALFTAY